MPSKQGALGEQRAEGREVAGLGPEAKDTWLSPGKEDSRDVAMLME